MKTPPTLTLPPRYTEDSIARWRAAINAGWGAGRPPTWQAPDGLVPEGRELVLYGEPLFAAAVADQLGIARLEPPTDWVASIPRDCT